MCVFGEAEVEAACVVGAQVLAKGGCSGAAEERCFGGDRREGTVLRGEVLAHPWTS